MNTTACIGCIDWPSNPTVLTTSVGDCAHCKRQGVSLFEVMPCHADVPSAESGSRSKQPSLETERPPSLHELVSRLIVVQTETLAAQIETNLLLRQTITHTTLMIDAMAAQSDEDDDISGGPQYLSDPRN